MKIKELALNIICNKKILLNYTSDVSNGVS